MNDATMPGAYHAGQHYENFPVGSWLVPKDLRQAVIAFYQFARQADDLADEGSLTAQERQAGLESLRAELGAASALGSPAQRLAHELKRRSLGLEDAHDLLDAFMQDTLNEPFANETDLLDYCRRSANPVGRFVLRLAGLAAPSEEQKTAFAYSDYICTGLQLANFAQDIGEDLRRNRVYLPKNWWLAGEDPRHKPSAYDHAARRHLSLKMADWANECLDQGVALAPMLRATLPKAGLRLAVEIGTTVAGGKEILRIISQDPLAVWVRSPSIRKWRVPLLIIAGMRYALRHDA